MLSFVHYNSPMKVAILTAFQCTQTCQRLDYTNNQSKPNTSLVKITKESSTSKYTFVFTSHIIEIMQKTTPLFNLKAHILKSSKQNYEQQCKICPFYSPDRAMQYEDRRSAAKTLARKKVLLG